MRTLGFCAFSVVGGWLALAGAEMTWAGAIDYNRDIRPILSDNCYACHGPDPDARKAGLRLDGREDAFKPLRSGGFAIVPGAPGKSELLQRVMTSDEDDRMPPAGSGKSLRPEQIDLLRRWIEAGAHWSGHWAYVKPQRPPLPEVRNTSWPRNEVDHFILARLEGEGLAPSPEADRRRLARRVSFDLRGLPPTVEELDEYLYDNSPGAYEKLVDRLLESSHYGERMAQDWLDLARYADSQGYHHDSHRDLWPWRDWVINAFNRNMPFDQFTVEQLAGDLVPNATREQRIATGFNRNEMTTSEGGAMPEEYSVKYVAGRVDTTARVWLGTSLACAECHDHKYDPISQKEYYQFFAYFNTVAEDGLDQGLNPVPRLVLDTPEQRQKLEQFTREIVALEKAHQVLLESPNDGHAESQAQWERQLRALNSSWTVLEPVHLAAASGSTLTKALDGSVLTGGLASEKDVYEVTLQSEALNIAGFRLEAMDAASPSNAAPAFVLSEIEAVARSARPELARAVARPDLQNWFSVGPFQAASGQEAFDKAFGPEKNVDLAQTFGGGKLKWTERASWPDAEVHSLEGENAATYLFRKIEAKESGWAKLAFGSGDGLQVWWNGRKVLSRNASRQAAPDQDRVVVDLAPGENRLLLKVSQGSGSGGFSFALLDEPVLEHPVEFSAAAADYSHTDHPPRLAIDAKHETGWAGGGKDSPGTQQAFFQTRHPFGFKEGTAILMKLRFGAGASGRAPRRFRVALTASERLAEFVSLPDPVRRHLLRDAGQLSATERMELQRFHREKFLPEVQELAKLLAAQRKARQDFSNSLLVTMVMQEMEKPRDTFLLIRGNFQQPGEKVEPGVPRAIFPMPEGYPANRLGLARWLTHPDHPLVSRVIVNHYWQHYFGTGLVKTAEDFGSQGDWPSHPELLDWLATEFVRSGWDVKAMQRLIVTSATYRQAAAVTAEALQRDPDARWLGRFPRLRLDAEAIRDNALAVSGLFNPKVGGPSVYPYQPPGLWEAVAFEGSRKYVQSEGAENYRRGLYTYWRRSLPYPSLINFDAPTRETCTIRRPRTNTPLQALNLMNDPVYVEAARAFGQRIMREGGSSVEGRLSYAFQWCLGRLPTRPERDRMESAFREHLDAFTRDRVAAARLLAVGVSSPPVELDPCELAAWTLIGSTLLNLDETITKG